MNEQASPRERIKQKLKELPDSPGCYLMKDSAGTVIYVGKAISLKNRVRSYFHGSHDPKTEALVEHIVDFEYTIVNNEAEALILESNLIKEYRPYYNILLRDDKHYPYLCLTLREDYPRLIVSRRAKNDGNKYFGPYVSAGTMRHAMQLIHDIFPLRSCSGRSWRKGQRACLNYHIGRCLAPCEGQVPKERYAEVVEQVQLFLQGKTKDLVQQTEKRMQQASEELRFEDAARLRDALQALSNVQQQQQLDNSGQGGNHDLIAVAAAEGQAVVQVFFVRNGKVVGREHFFLTDALSRGEDVEQAAQAELLRRFLQEYYGGSEFVPRHIYTRPLPEDQPILEQIFSERAGHKVEISQPQRGDKLRLIKLVEQNAKLTLDQYLNSRERREERAAAGLEQLRVDLDLRQSPARMECYDISHIQGAHMVGSMVVFLNGNPAPGHYRRFKIKTLDGSNDFAALQEVIERRWKRGLKEREENKQPLDFGNFPDLLVIDGGKGQLSAVCERLQELGAAKTDIISLAKREEEVFLPGQSEPILLAHDTPGLQLLQRLRDEAHRFAITYHRQLRGKGQVKSELEGVPGIGEKRRKALLKAFGSLKNIKKAELEELIAAPGMTVAAAEALYRYLHPPQQPGGEGEADAPTTD